ncbi:amino acid adenylation domain-containing protein [Nannocystis bainbridge]|uniref:Amino acid adenylation domain-containing protein n=1 Tax=Nannocystis bainbridge TaxID=2995303 RepID=A0ABT5E8D3_9BACT|nr:amino acid adenylation domain-containing protein [Nannocystis bainbridge]MDC0721158.1 amino acid adenylation domain-containing protein [Nannocystis bainbridge]
MQLADLVISAARSRADAPAVIGPDGALTYGELDALANRLARALARRGVVAGDRVGLWLEKSGRGVAAMQACLRLGAVYVPLDPLSPAARVAGILGDCTVRCVVTTEARRAALAAADAPAELAVLHVDSDWHEVLRESADSLPPPARGPDDLAYILYTSGSTGKPKGVCISHRNALAFVEWAAEAIAADSQDRFANHAPFHFDLSVLDLYVAFLAGAAVALVPEGLSYAPRRLVEFVREHAISVWYSVPSALALMMEVGELSAAAAPTLRAILFAGEPFPIKPLRRLRAGFPAARLFNLYGPTETNVCTYHEVTTLADDRSAPVPIGRACSGDEVWAVRADGERAGPGEEGELIVAGPTVMLGYWGQPPQRGPYATGDIVRGDDAGEYTYIGRRDHMVKIRGHRVELGDIEAALLQHPDIREVAVAVRGAGIDARLHAFVVAPPPAELSLLGLKRHCAERLPRYMIVDDFTPVTALPRTGNGKVDRLALARLAAASSSTSGEQP